MTSEKVYTLADCPPGTHPGLWKQIVEQGKVESSIFEKLPELEGDEFLTDAEFETLTKWHSERREQSRQRKCGE